MKYLKGIIVGLFVLCLSAVAAQASVLDLKPGTIMVHNAVYNSDFAEFYEATSHDGIDHYRIILHTPGGDAFSCTAIINRMLELQKKGIKFTTELYGMGMSAGSYIFMMGDERIVHQGAILMWHTIEAQIEQAKKDGQFVRVPENSMRMIRLLDNNIRRLFKRATGMSDESVRYWLDGGGAQFMSALTAYNVGIATKLIRN